jgi:6-phosphogluconolactonase
VGPTPEADALAVEPALRAPAPWSAVMLGMGEDGHIASLFPGDPDLASWLDPDGERLCVGVPVAGLEPFVPRISLTVRALLDTRLVMLLINGQAKRALIERVGAEPAYAPPVAAILRQGRAPVRVLWAP